MGRLINIGYANQVNSDKIVAVVVPDSAPSKRLIQTARDKGYLIDATQGRRTRAMIVTESGHVVLSALMPETISNRYAQEIEFISSKDNKADE
ncbi:UPF0296 protein [Clostridia bacterium]|nr:UPF0296 protein [Clostridia bacterium]